MNSLSVTVSNTYNNFCDKGSKTINARSRFIVRQVLFGCKVNMLNIVDIKYNRLNLKFILDHKSFLGEHREDEKNFHSRCR